MFVSMADELIAEGVAEGLIRGKIECLLQLVDRRGLEVHARQRERLEACVDEAQLQRWFDRAITAASPADLFEG